MRQKRTAITSVLVFAVVSMFLSQASSQTVTPSPELAKKPVEKSSDLMQAKAMRLTGAEVSTMRLKQAQQDEKFAAAAAEASRQMRRRKASFEKEQNELLLHESDSAGIEIGKLRGMHAASPAETKPKINSAAIRDKGLSEVTPHITGHIGALQSDNGILIFGENFGPCCGTVELSAMGYDMALEVEEWHDDVISGFVPARASTACLTGEIQVSNQKGKASNTLLLPVPLLYKSLSWEDVKIVHCSEDSNNYRCNDYLEIGQCWWLFGGIDQASNTGGSAIYGSHGNCSGAVGDDSGTDVFEIDLKGGWVLDNARFVSTISEQGEAWTRPRAGELPSGYLEGASFWRPEIEWLATPGDSLQYGLFIGIRGPECSSHK